MLQKINSNGGMRFTFHMLIAWFQVKRNHTTKESISNPLPTKKETSWITNLKSHSNDNWSCQISTLNNTNVLPYFEDGPLRQDSYLMSECTFQRLHSSSSSDSRIHLLLTDFLASFEVSFTLPFGSTDRYKTGPVSWEFHRHFICSRALSLSSMWWLNRWRIVLAFEWVWTISSILTEGSVVYGGRGGHGKALSWTFCRRMTSTVVQWLAACDVACTLTWKNSRLWGHIILRVILKATLTSHSPYPWKVTVRYRTTIGRSDFQNNMQFKWAIFRILWVKIRYPFYCTPPTRTTSIKSLSQA